MIKICYKSLRAEEVLERTGTFLWEDKKVPLKRHFYLVLVFLINTMKVGDRVRVTQSTTIYHHPAHKGQGFDLKGQEGEIIAIITEWQGRPVSANFPIQVKFPEKLKAHLREDELEVI